MKRIAPSVAFVAISLSACSLTSQSAPSTSAPKPGPNDYQTCTDVSTDIGMMSTYGMLYGPQTRQLDTDASDSNNAILRQQAEIILSATDPNSQGVSDSPRVSTALGAMAVVCKEFGLYNPATPSIPSTTTPYPMPVGPSPTS